MIDTLLVRKLIPTGVLTTAAIGLDATQLSFPRISSSDKAERRQNLTIDSLSPTVVRISHQPRTASNPIQRSLVAIDQTLTRKDALLNPISSVSFKVALQCDIPSGVTLAEFRAAAVLLLGLLAEADAANLTAIYNGEY